MRYLTGLMIALSLTAGAAAGEVRIDEWTVPWERSRPRDPYPAPDGGIWFNGQGDDYVARLDPATGEMIRVDLPPGSGPHNLIVDADGDLWIAGNGDAYVGHMDGETHALRRINMPQAEARDPHTLLFGAPDQIWFTLQGSNMVGRLDIATDRIDLIEIGTDRARPYGITMAPDGTPWVALFGTARLARIDTTMMTSEELRLPRANTRVRRLVSDLQGRIWYADYAGGRLGVFHPGSRHFEEWILPGGEGAQPYALEIDGRGRLWMVETGPAPNRLVGFDPPSGRFFGTTEIASGGGAIRHMVFDADTGVIWFGTDTNTVGRAFVLEAEVEG